MGSEMGPLSSSGASFYRLRRVTIGLSLAIFALLRMFQADGQTEGRIWSSKKRHYALIKCIGRQLLKISVGRLE